MSMDRRTALVVIGNAAAASSQAQTHAEHASSSAASKAKPYQFRFFSKEEVGLVEALSEIIIPTDSHSPGAREARVVEFIDWMVFHGSPDVQAQWKDGLALVDAEGRRLHDRSFVLCSPEQQDGVVASMAQNESSPTTPIERFFRMLKLSVVNGYYTSAIGLHKELRYQGNRPKPVFVGCTHPEHQQG
jgi:gluconate 2-dehydrogenase gamma chain